MADISKFSTSLPSVKILSELSVEVILLISDVLPLDDIICFSLCSHRLYEILIGPIRRLKHREDENLLSLIRLERDLPGYFACDICKILHPFDGSEISGLSGLRREQSCNLPCVQSGAWFRAPFVLDTMSAFDHSLSRLSFLHVKLAMKGFYHGLSGGISTDALEYTQVREYRDLLRDDSDGWLTIDNVLWLFSMKHIICPDPLGFYVRMQDIIVVERWEYLFLRSSPHSRITQLMACRHLSVHTFIGSWIRTFMSLEGEATDLIMFYDRRCARCNVSYHIKLFESDSKPTIVLTRWLNIGVGVTKDDPAWKLQAYPYWRTEPKMLNKKKLSFKSSPRLCYEATACQSFDDLTSLNLSYLKDRQYIQTMTFASGSDWKERDSYASPQWTTNFTRCPDTWYISGKGRSALVRVARDSGESTQVTTRDAAIVADDWHRAYDRFGNIFWFVIAMLYFTGSIDFTI